MVKGGAGAVGAWLLVAHHEPRGVAEFVLVVEIDAARVIRAVHRDVGITTLDCAADVHANGVVRAHLALDVRRDLDRRDDRRVGELARVGDVIRVGVCQEHVVGGLDVRRPHRGVWIVEERVDQQVGVADGDVPRRVAVPGEFHCSPSYSRRALSSVGDRAETNKSADARSSGQPRVPVRPVRSAIPEPAGVSGSTPGSSVPMARSKFRLT